MMALGNSVVDVAMDTQGVELERRAQRPLLSRLHVGHRRLGRRAPGADRARRHDLSVVAHFGVAA